MSFHLQPDELTLARDVITSHGYSTLLPTPPEWDAVLRDWATVEASLAGLDLFKYTPHEPMRIYAPKGSKVAFRVISLLRPEDLLIYTALVAQLKRGIEAARVPVGRKIVFSYRADLTNPSRLYRREGERAAFVQRALRLAKSAKFVALADIADFYPRLNQHRLINSLKLAAGSDPRTGQSVQALEMFLSRLAKRNSYGIPVGPHASRLLGEAALIDVDEALLAEGCTYVRWVDDFYIFANREDQAIRALYRLGQWLYDHHGLTLQQRKTLGVLTPRSMTV